MVTRESKLNSKLFWSFLLHITAICLGFFQVANAEVANGPKRSAADWGRVWEADEESNRADDDRSAILSRIVVVRKSASGFVVVPIEQADASADSFLKVPEDRQVSLTRFVNKTSSAKQSGSSQANPCEVSHQTIASCFNVDAILDVSGSRWVLYARNLKSNSLTKIAEGPAGEGDQYFKWVHSKLNYDGIIVDVDGDYLLVLLPPGRAGSEIQALTIQDSAEKVLLPKNRVKGTSLLQSIQRSGRYAVFIAVISDPNAKKSFAKGSKLIIEKGS